VPPVSSLRRAAAPLIGGGLLAGLELAGGLLLGFAALGRAEALLFLAIRPWILLLAALVAARWSLWKRVGLYAAALAAAAAGETILLLALGSADPWAETLRGLAAGLIVAAVADFTLQVLRRTHETLGTLAGVLLLVALIFFASGLRPYEALLLGPTAPREAAAPKPRLVLMTALPIVWGAGGAFDPGSRPAESFRALEREFQVAPIDAIEPAALRGHRLMLLAQPRLLAPDELVALDAWVRSGGRALILTDPMLVAAREFPIMDVRRPPEQGMLAPLLGHWGLRLEPGTDHAGQALVASGGRLRRLAMSAPGRFAIAGNSCRIAGRPWIARCRIGRGEALLIADADLLTDAGWVAPAARRGNERHLRTADNMVIVADWLDALADAPRERRDRPVAWIADPSDLSRALLLASSASIAALIAGIAMLVAARSRTNGARKQSTNLSTGGSAENRARTETRIDP
jgi:hypothetical protein